MAATAPSGGAAGATAAAWFATAHFKLRGRPTTRRGRFSAGAVVPSATTLMVAMPVRALPMNSGN